MTDKITNKKLQRSTFPEPIYIFLKFTKYISVGNMCHLPAGSLQLFASRTTAGCGGCRHGTFGVNLEKSSLYGMWMEIIDVGAIINRPLEKIIAVRYGEMR